MFLKMSQNSQENTCARVSFFKKKSLLFKKRRWHRFIPVSFEIFLRTPFFIERLWWLLLKIAKIIVSTRGMQPKEIFISCVRETSWEMIRELPGNYPEWHAVNGSFCKIWLSKLWKNTFSKILPKPSWSVVFYQLFIFLFIKDII